MASRDFCQRARPFGADILALNRRFWPQRERFGGALNQVVRAGTAIGANIEEAQVANSRRDMAVKYAVALREARETLYWLDIMSTDPMVGNTLEPSIAEANEWIAMLTATVKKLRS